MSGEKFYLDLTGRPLDGYRTEEVAADLARLLRIPRKSARNLLRGKPLRIKREFEKEKAIHLMGKIVACGAQCEVTPREIQDDDSQAIEANIELPKRLELEIDPPKMALDEMPAQAEELPQTEEQPEKLELEIDPPKMSLEEMPAQAEELPETEVVPGVPAPVQSGLHPAKTISDVLPAARESGGQPRQVGSVAADKGDVGGVSAATGSGRQRVLLFAVVAAALLAVAVWAGLDFIGGSEPLPQPDVTAETPTLKAAPETVPGAANTRQRMESLARAVKIWMIQYGAGFDPSQVTMARMQQDLGISPEEMEDGWGTPFRYVAADERYTIISAGPDRTFGNTDDVSAEKSAR